MGEALYKYTGKGANRRKRGRTGTYKEYSKGQIDTLTKLTSSKKYQNASPEKRTQMRQDAGLAGKRGNAKKGSTREGTIGPVQGPATPGKSTLVKLRKAAPAAQTRESRKLKAAARRKPVAAVKPVTTARKKTTKKTAKKPKKK